MVKAADAAGAAGAGDKKTTEGDAESKEGERRLEEGTEKEKETAEKGEGEEESKAKPCKTLADKCTGDCSSPGCSKVEGEEKCKFDGKELCACKENSSAVAGVFLAVVAALL